MGSMSVHECVDVDLVEPATYEEEGDHQAENGENTIEHEGSIDAFGEIWRRDNDGRVHAQANGAPGDLKHVENGTAETGS